ncbi:MAG: hypothetical protein FWE32_07280 [Oscillospiraceae bacterium]|nr:hypothetical protein [Oscillospiraceae bacterium]
MMEKVAYLKGLAEGLGIDNTTKEGKVLGAMIDLLDDMALAITDVGEGFVMMGEELDAIQEEVDDIIEDLYSEEDEDDCCCHQDFDGELYEVACPSCGDIVYVDEDMLDQGEIACPGCGEDLEFDLDGELDDDEPEDEE